MVVGWALWAGTVWAGVVLPGTSVEVELAPAAEEVVVAGLAELEARRFADAAARFEAAAPTLGPVEFGYLAAVARYESGDLRSAERLVGELLALRADHLPGLDLQGLVLADLGRGDEALGRLHRAVDGAEAAGDLLLAARARVHLGLVHDDRGEPDEARAAWTSAVALADEAGFPAVADEARTQLAALDRHGAVDLVGRVAEALRRGDRSDAHALLEGASQDRRGRLRAAIARGMVERADGRLDEAVDVLEGAAREANRSGLVREGAAARLELAHALQLAGEVQRAREALGVALQAVAGTSLRIREVDLRLASARLAARMGDAPGARGQLDAATVVAGRVLHPSVGPSLAEVTGIVRALEGDRAAGAASLSQAVEGWVALGYRADAARAAAERVRVTAWGSGNVAQARADALSRFAAAGDARGAAHVAIAEGLGLASAGAAAPALEAFARALREAVKVGDLRLRAVAEENVAETLRVLGHDPQAVQKARELGLEDAVARHGRLEAARTAYAQGKSAFEAGRHGVAADAFDLARQGFDQLGERDDGRAALRGSAWSRWNLAVGQDPGEALPAFQRVAADAATLGDEELVTRAQAGAAIAAARLGRDPKGRGLQAAIEASRSAGLDALAARCAVELAELPLPLDERAAAARQAVSLARGPDTAWALYSVAVDAYREDRTELAVALAQEALPIAGPHRQAVEEVLAAAREFLDEVQE